MEGIWKTATLTALTLEVLTLTGQCVHRLGTHSGRVAFHLFLVLYCLAHVLCRDRTCRVLNPRSWLL
jgi:hypothetical protein